MKIVWIAAIIMHNYMIVEDEENEVDLNQEFLFELTNARVEQYCLLHVLIFARFV